MRQRAQAYGSKDPRAGLAWLAIIALLINAFLPTAISAARTHGALIVGNGALCGAAPGAPAKHTSPAPHHCVLCLAAAAGVVPAHGPTRLPPQYAAVAAPEFPAREPPPARLAYGAARPRGPPIAG